MRREDIVLFDASDAEFPVAFHPFDDVTFASRHVVASGLIDPGALCFKRRYPWFGPAGAFGTRTYPIRRGSGIALTAFRAELSQASSSSALVLNAVRSTTLDGKRFGA